jgi:hypothetical protein
MLRASSTLLVRESGGARRGCGEQRARLTLALEGILNPSRQFQR